MYKHQTHFMMPEDVRALKEFVMQNRTESGEYDIAVGGSMRRADWEEEREYISSLAEAGATWWVEYIPPDEEDFMRKCIARGPLRIDAV
jgi:hypothetical protein